MQGLFELLKTIGATRPSVAATVTHPDPTEQALRSRRARGANVSLDLRALVGALAAEQVARALVGRTVADVERDLIMETLKHCGGNRTYAANILGISIRTLRNKLNAYARAGVAVPPRGAGDAGKRELLP